VETYLFFFLIKKTLNIKVNLDNNKGETSLLRNLK